MYFAAGIAVEKVRGALQGHANHRPDGRLSEGSPGDCQH
jgi:hypothetical protein